MADVPVSKTEPGSVIGVSVVESVDAADHAGRFHGWDLRIDQVSYGRFAGRLVMIRLGSLEIIRETTSQALIKQGSAWPDSLVFSLPLAASNEGYFNGRPLAFPNVLLSDGADLPPLLTPTQLDVVSIAIARDRLASLLETLGERRAADFVAGHRQQNHCFSGLPGGLSTLQHGFREICDQGDRLQPAIGFARARASLEDTVVDALADILSENAWRDVNSVTAQKRIVDRNQGIRLRACRRAPEYRRAVPPCRRQPPNAAGLLSGCARSAALALSAHAAAERRAPRASCVCSGRATGVNRRCCGAMGLLALEPLHRKLSAAVWRAAVAHGAACSLCISLGIFASPPARLPIPDNADQEPVSGFAASAAPRTIGRRSERDPTQR